MSDVGGAIETGGGAEAAGQPAQGGRRLAGACGVLYVLLSGAVGALAPLPPSTADDAAAISAYFASHGGAFLLGNYAGVLAFVPYLPFLAYLTQAIRRAEGDRGFAGLTFLAAGVAGHAEGAACLGAFQVIALVVGPGSGPAQKAACDLANVLFGFFFVVQVAFLGAAAWAVLATRVLPRALGYAAIVVALLSLVASAGTIATTGPLAAGGPVSVAALSAYLAWSLAVSVVLLVTPGRGYVVQPA